MNARKHIPRWQIVLVLVIFCVLYMLNTLTPWAERLFVDQDRAYYMPFWGSVMLLLWVNAVLVIVFVRKSGRTLADIGFRPSGPKTAALFGSLLALGAVMVFCREVIVGTGPDSPSFPPQAPKMMLAFYPATLPERVFWVFMALSTGFCEELVYRGFGITVLRDRGFRLWQALLLATLSNVFMHGLGGVFLFPVVFLLCLFLAGVFLWTKSLVPGIMLHSLMDLLAVFGPS